ncbi:precorrin-8X methylmutase [Thiocapsa sp.]|uniref:precorrin-8X methylmutase n=1 Tax=Thiocapsa sp. TaxID=2024551 RepID=UPI003593B5B2
MVANPTDFVRKPFDDAAQPGPRPAPVFGKKNFRRLVGPFAIIVAEAGSHEYDPAQWTLVRRLIYASGDFDPRANTLRSGHVALRSRVSASMAAAFLKPRKVP